MTDYREVVRSLPEEVPEKRARLFESLEGKQLSRLHYDEGAGPWGGAMFGFEFRDATRLIVEACRDLTEGVQAVWILRPILIVDENWIWTPSHERRLTSGRLQVGEEYAAGVAGAFQRRVEGEILAHSKILPEVNRLGGEQLLMTFQNRGAMLAEAMPGGRGFTARYNLSWLPESKIFDSPILRQ